MNQYVADTAVLGGLFEHYTHPALDPRQNAWEPADCIGLLLRLTVMRGQDERWFEEPFRLGSLRYQQEQDPMPPAPGQGWNAEHWSRFSRAIVGPTVCDDVAGSVQAPMAGPLTPGAPDRREFLSVSNDLVARMNAFVEGQGPFANPYGESLNPYWEDGEYPVSCFTDTHPCSEAWAFDGRAMVDGAPILVAEPRLPLFVPSIWVEWYMECPEFRVRGAGLPGTPFLFVGASAANAWGVSSLEIDQVDLYKLTVHPDEEAYLLDGAWVPLTDREESIWVAGEAQPVRIRLRDTIFGPVVNHILSPEARGTYARRAIPLHDTSADGASAFVEMYRAKSVRQFRAALGQWVTPPANLVFSNALGRVGYQAVGALPVRRPRQVVDTGSCAPEVEDCFRCVEECEVEIGPLAGWVAQDGTRSENLWGANEILPSDLLPHVEPSQGYVFTANNLPAGSWYPIPNRPGLAGHTLRSRRLVERLDALWREFAEFGIPIDPADVRAPRTDTQLSTLADLVRLARWVVDCHALDPDCPLTINLAGNQHLALEELEGWLEAGGTLAHAPQRPAQRALLLAYVLPLTFRDNELAEIYGGGHSGLELYLKDAMCRIDSGEGLTDLEADWVRLRLRQGWNIMIALQTANEQRDPCRLGPGDPDLSVDDPATWMGYVEEHLLARRIPHWVDFEMNGPYCEAVNRAPLSLDPFDPPTTEDVTLVNAFPDVLWGQSGQLFSQVTRFTSEGPVVTSMLMPEQAEPGRPGPRFKSQIGLWETGQQKPGPMSLGFTCRGGECPETRLRYAPR